MTICKHNSALFLLTLAMGLSLAGGAVLAGESNLSLQDVDRLFHDAGRFYSAGQVKEAIDGYNEIVDAGYVSPELFYNLGNTWFAAGRCGNAILNYRRAWYMSPCDRDIGRNIVVAARRAGVAMPPRSRVDCILERLSLDEWIAVGVVLYWLSACLVGIRIVAQRPVAWVQGGIILIVLALLLPVIGVRHWTSSLGLHEAVLLQSRRAMFAPSESSAVQIELCEGTIVRVGETSGDWVRVRTQVGDGWLPSSVIGLIHRSQSGVR